MLRIESLRAGYDRLEVLHAIDLAVGGGRAVVVLGANGAGKSTLCRAISGLIPCRAGRVDFEDRDATRLSTAQRVRLGIVQVPEGRQMFPQMTVKENLRLGAWVHGEPGPTTLSLVYDLFPVLGERSGQQAGLLSGGEQQMLAIGRAMMARPRLLVLDEPSQGLAPKAVAQVASAVRAIQLSGVSILLVEQNLALAEAVAEHAYVLETGRCVADGPASELLSMASVAASYLGH
jgi:branched-chain amino acid transport system ATP-binding protein